jgi:protein involved in polysaccharide export with SLBB domain
MKLRSGAIVLLSMFALWSPTSTAQSVAGNLATRDQLIAFAEKAESLAISGNREERTRSALLAASLRQRLRDGDIQVGDRVIVTVVSDAIRRDTLVVRSGRVLELPGSITVSVAGALRSELRDRVAVEVLKYVKAERVETVALMRVGVLGEVTRPGYFAFAPDMPITDAIMSAGGPTAGADFKRTVLRRSAEEVRSAEEIRIAIARGLTLDQLGMSAGDELVIGRKKDKGGAILGMAGTLGSLLAVVVALSR